MYKLFEQKISKYFLFYETYKKKAALLLIHE